MTKFSLSTYVITACLLSLSPTAAAQIPDLPARIMEAPPTVEVCLLEPEEAHSDVLNQMRSTVSERTNHEPTAEFEVTFANRCSSREWPQAAQEAFLYATDIWATHIRSTIPIRILAAWDNDFDSPSTLASAGPTFLVQDDENEIPLSSPNTWYPIAQANAMSGMDHHPGSPSGTHDIVVRINCLNSRWDFGTDESVEGYDLVTVVLHEIGHGLGFLGTMSSPENEDIAEWGNLPDSEPDAPRIPLIYDRFPEAGTGFSVLNEDVFPNPSNELYRAVTGREEGLFFGGSEALRMNNFVPVPLFDPSEWLGGSSYSHLDTQSFSVNSDNALMRHSISRDLAIRSPGPVFCGMFFDMNWPLGQSCQALLQRDALLVLSEETVSFDLTNVNTPTDAILTLSNDASSSDMMNGTITKEGDQFSLISDNSFTVEPGESLDIVLRFDPFVAGSFNGTVNINHNATNLPSPLRIPLLGRALEQGILAQLVQNYPNPFSNQTTIDYELPEPAHVMLELFDQTGRRVELLVDNQKPAGAYQVVLARRDLASGVYYYRIRIDDFTETKSLVVIR